MSTDQPAPDDPREDLQVSARPLGAGRHLVTVEGALDLHTASQLSDVLQPLLLTGGRRVLVDLSGVAFLDSTGLTCLIAAYRTARNTGARLSLIAPGERVRRMLAVTGTDQVLPSYATVDSVPD
ncbi:STAS domain-containing protein [Streptomyces sp. NPDC059787]|uniref:STAS domain-containing protein n=1 Tax=Streptomyces sp. NPDC059787 TaxID=3346947 RepID=UPI00365F117D